MDEIKTVVETAETVADVAEDIIPEAENFMPIIEAAKSSPLKKIAVIGTAAAAGALGVKAVVNKIRVKRGLPKWTPIKNLFNKKKAQKKDNLPDTKDAVEGDFRPVEEGPSKDPTEE